MRKYRHELKFIISSSAAEILKHHLSLILTKDKNGYYEDGSYLIRSLYFDDLESTSYLEKLNGELYRKKYRIRTYNDDEGYIRLERKYKHNNLTSKDQTLISMNNYSKIIKGQINDIKTDDKLLLEFLRDVKINNLVPSVIVEYHRIAFVYPVSDVRVTFDSHIKSGLYNYDLFDETKTTYEVNEKGTQVLEVKYNEILPLHIDRILGMIPSYRKAVSKFALCRSIK